MVYLYYIPCLRFTILAGNPGYTYFIQWEYKFNIPANVQSLSQGTICFDNVVCCQTEAEAADQTCCHTKSCCIDTRQTTPSTDPTMPGIWQGSHYTATVLSKWYDSAGSWTPCLCFSRGYFYLYSTEAFVEKTEKQESWTNLKFRWQVGCSFGTR